MPFLKIYMRYSQIKNSPHLFSGKNDCAKKNFSKILPCLCDLKFTHDINH